MIFLKLVLSVVVLLGMIVAMASGMHATIFTVTEIRLSFNQCLHANAD